MTALRAGTAQRRRQRHSGETAHRDLRRQLRVNMFSIGAANMARVCG